MQFIRIAPATVLSIIVAFSASASFAQQRAEDFPKDKRYFTVSKPEIREIVDVSSDTPYLAFDGGNSIDEESLGANPLVILDQVINIGEKIWTIIEKNKPVVNVESTSASALPSGITDWRQMAGWQAPASRAWRITYKNGYNMNVVDFTYRIIYTYGGSYQGQGRYLAQVSVVPATLNVAWGYKFDAQAEVPTVTNAGTATNPIAGAQVRIHWAINTPIKSIQNVDAYYVQGDGYFKALQ